jgi:hypothetical protein
MSDPKKIVFEQSSSVPEGETTLATAVLQDFADTLQVLADWMFKTKALC